MRGGKKIKFKETIYTSCWQSGEWTQSGDLNHARAGHSCTAVEGLGVLVAAGLTDVNYVHSVELFDPDTGTWTLQSNLPFPNFGKGYIFYKWNVRKIGKF